MVDLILQVSARLGDRLEEILRGSTFEHRREVPRIGAIRRLCETWFTSPQVRDGKTLIRTARHQPNLLVELFSQIRTQAESSHNSKTGQEDMSQAIVLETQIVGVSGDGCSVMTHNNPCQTEALHGKDALKGSRQRRTCGRLR